MNGYIECTEICANSNTKKNECVTKLARNGGSIIIKPHRMYKEIASHTHTHTYTSISLVPFVHRDRPDCRDSFMQNYSHVMRCAIQFQTHSTSFEIFGIVCVRVRAVHQWRGFMAHSHAVVARIRYAITQSLASCV